MKGVGVHKLVKARYLVSCTCMFLMIVKLSVKRETVKQLNINMMYE